jgi:hypothetical protein
MGSSFGFDGRVAPLSRGFKPSLLLKSRVPSPMKAQARHQWLPLHTGRFLSLGSTQYLWETPNLLITPLCSSDDLERYLPMTLDLVFDNAADARPAPLRNRS